MPHATFTYSEYLQMKEFNFTAIRACDPEMGPLLTRYCQHTGKPTGTVGEDEFAELIKVHGEEITLSILQMTQKTYAPEWIWQNDEGLGNLALWQPKEYFIYAMSTLMFPASGKSASPLNAVKDEDYQNRILAWQNIQAFDIEIIKPIAELCRRIIAKCKPAILYKVLGKCQHTNVAEITANLESLTAFHLELEDLLKWLVANLTKLEAEDKRGFANFAAQKMIMALSTLEREVCQEMNDFELIPDKKPLQVELIVGQRYAKSQPKKERYSGKPRIADHVPQLKFGSCPKMVEQAYVPPIEPAKPAFKPTFKMPKGEG